MKKSAFLSFICAMLASQATLAAVHTVDSATSFATAWNGLSAGDSLLVTSDIDLSSVGTLTPHSFSVNISSENGSTLTWTGATGECPLPASVKYQGVIVTSAPARILEGGNITIDINNSFVSNNEGIVKTSGNVQIHGGNKFESNLTSGNGAVVNLDDGGSLKIDGGNEFRNNMASGRGGAVYLADAATAPADGTYSAVLDASSADIIFSGNTENVVLSGGSVVDPGFANDIYIGSNRTVNMIAAADKTIEIAGGLASTDSTAVIEKTGAGRLLVGDAEFYAGALKVKEGSVVVDENRSWGNGTSSALVTVAAAGVFELRSGATLSQNIDLQGGNLSLHKGAVLNSALTASSPSTITLQFTPGAITAPSISTSPWLTIAPNGAISQAAAGNLTLNLNMTSFTQRVEAAGKVFAVDYTNTRDAATAGAVQSIAVSYTDATGTHTTELKVGADGMLDISTILDAMFSTTVPELAPQPQPVLLTGTNSMRSSIFSLSWLSDATRTTAPVVEQKGKSRIWGTAMGENMNLSSSGAKYDFSGGGYAIGVEQQVADNTYFGIALGQTFGSGDAEKSTTADAGSTVDQMAIMLGLYTRYNQMMNPNQSLSFDAFFGYASVDSELESSQGADDWRDDVFSLSMRLTFNQRLDDRVIFSPFVALEYSSASQGSYSVGGNRYTDGEASVLSMPIGVTLSARITECEQKSITPYITAAFVPRLASDTPEAKVVGPGGFSSRSRGAKFESCSYRIQGGVRVEWDDQWTTDVSAGIYTDSSQTSFHIGAAASYAF